MRDVLNYEFFRRTTTAGISDALVNESYTLLVAQVEGAFDSLDLVLECRVQEGAEWVTVAGINLSAFDGAAERITAPGIYQFPIEGVREIRLRVVTISGGWVTVGGVLYDSADGSTAPKPISQSLMFGDPALFVKGAAEQIFFDPQTGNIVGYDKTATESAVSTSVNLTEITGGIGNRLIEVLPDTVRIEGTYTAAAFSLPTRAAIMGGNIAYDAVSTTCETITAGSATLTVSAPPAPALGENPSDGSYWCYVKERGADEQSGVNVGINPSTRQVENFSAEAGKVYEVTYSTHKASSQSLAIPSRWNPVIMTVQIRYAVYAKQGGRMEQSAFAGWLYFVAPRCILNADAGISATQTGNATTGGSWLALSTKRENMPGCECDDGRRPTAYYVYVPCVNPNDRVFDVVSVGNGLTLRAGQSDRIPVKLVMADDSLVQPDFATLGYRSENDRIATVTNDGMVEGHSAGETVIWTYLNKSDGSMISCQTRVLVTTTRTVLSANRNNIIFG